MAALEGTLRLSKVQSQAGRVQKQDNNNNYSSIRPQRGAEGWAWAHVPVQMLGFACFHHAKLEVRRCNAPPQETSSLLEIFIAVKVSLFRTSQKYWCALHECVSIHISKNAYLLNDLLQAARKRQGRAFKYLYKLYIIYVLEIHINTTLLMLYLPSDFEKTAQTEEKMFPILNLFDYLPVSG